MTQSNQPIFQNRRFTVTRSDVKTPTMFYPVQDTVGRVRRDLQFISVSMSALFGAALYIYWDLWFPHEKVVMGGVITMAFIMATCFSLLQIDARGFPSRIFFSNKKTIRAVFKAITDAKAMNAGTHSGNDGNDNDTE